MTIVGTVRYAHDYAGALQRAQWSLERVQDWCRDKVQLRRSRPLFWAKVFSDVRSSFRPTWHHQ